MPSIDGRRPAGFCGGAFLFTAVILPVLASCATVSAVDGRPLPPAQTPGEVRPEWAALPGFGYRETCLTVFSGRVLRPRLEFHALRVSLTGANAGIVTSAGRPDGEGGFLSTRVTGFVRDYRLLAGINALPFDPVSAGEGEARTNVGLVVSDGKVTSPPHPGFDALVFFDDGRAAILSQSGIDLTGVVNAVGGFRKVLEDGRPVYRVLYAQSRHPRSAAGISGCGGYLYLLAVDGRRRRSAGATEKETALLLAALGAAEGLNLDGGGSTALAVSLPDGSVRLLNTPVHRVIPGRERAVAGSIGVAAR